MKNCKILNPLYRWSQNIYDLWASCVLAKPSEEAPWLLSIFQSGHFYTVNRALPRFLRVLTTLLPVWDLILTLNPETLFLFLLVPPKVLFVISIYACIELDTKVNLSVHCTFMFQVPKYVEVSMSPIFWEKAWNWNIPLFLGLKIFITTA